MPRWILPLFLLLLPSLHAAEPLRWKFDQDASWTTRAEEEITWTTVVGGKASVSRLTNRVETTWKVIETHASGAAVVEKTVTKVYAKLELPKLEPIVYDSTSANKPTGDAKTLMAAAEKQLHKTVRLAATPRGEFTIVIDTPAASNEQPATDLRLIFPEEVVAVGGTWTPTTTGNSPPELKQNKLIFRLDALDDVARISFRSEDWQAALQALSDRPQIKSYSQTGSAVFDPTLGRLRAAESQQQLVTVSGLKDAAVEVTTQHHWRCTVE